MVMIVCVGQETEYSGCNGNDSVCSVLSIVFSSHHCMPSMWTYLSLDGGKVQLSRIYLP